MFQNDGFRCRSWRSGRAQVAVEDGGARGRWTMRIWRRRRTKKSRTSTLLMKETLASLRFGKQIVLEWGISSKVENADGERERARRAALLDWDGDYSHFQRDEVQPVETCWNIATCHQDDLQDVKKFSKVNCRSRRRRGRRRMLICIQKLKKSQKLIVKAGGGGDDRASSRSSQHPSQLETIAGFFLSFCFGSILHWISFVLDRSTTLLAWITLSLTTTTSLTTRAHIQGLSIIAV